MSNMKMTPRYATFRGPSGVLSMSQPPDNDDEFSDFKSGLPVSPSPCPGRSSLHAPLLSSNLLQYNSSPTHKSQGKGSSAAHDVGSRLANYNLGLNQERSESCLIGDEDKYSPLRAFLQAEGQTTQESHSTAPIVQASGSRSGEDDADFGDFQSSLPSWNSKEEHLAVFPQIPPLTPNTPVSTFQDIPSYEANSTSGGCGTSVRVPFSITTHTILSPYQGTSDDFGDFVSFSEEGLGSAVTSSTSSSQSKVPLTTTGSRVASFSSQGAGVSQHVTSFRSQETRKSIDLFNIEISETVTRKKAGNVPVPDKFGQVRRDSSLLLELDGLNHDEVAKGTVPAPPPRLFNLDGLPPPPLKTTLISGPSPSKESPLKERAETLEPFGDFVSTPIVVTPTINLNLKDDLPGINILSKKSTPETMSVSSLDLGNYGASGWDTADTIPSSKGLNSIPKEIQRSSPLLTNEDKYSPFKQEQQREVEKCVTDWRRILETCLRLIEEGERFFHSVSSSHILREVIQTEKGRAYVLSLRQVYLVACRVYQSWMRSGGNEILGELHQKLALAWDSMSPFLLGTDLEEDFRRRSPMSDEDAENVCGICLIGTGWRDGEEEESWRLSLDFGGTLYHLPCANLWLNQVDSNLPALNTTKNKTNCTTHHFQTLI